MTGLDYHSTMLEFADFLTSLEAVCLDARFYTPVTMKLIRKPKFSDLHG